MQQHKPRTFTELEDLRSVLNRGNSLDHCVLQGLDLRGIRLDPEHASVAGSVFLGCSFSDEQTPHLLQSRGARVFPAFPDRPYNPYRSALYTWRELMEGYNEEEDHSLDSKVYNHALAARSGGHDIMEDLSQRLHDHAIDDALQDLLHTSPERNVVAIMGGHGTARSDPFFRKVTKISRELTRTGYFVASGGGPGIMEAANLGAYLAPADDDALDHAIGILSQSDTYRDSGYVEKAREVLSSFPSGAESLAIPTWFYGHEPSNLFASHIAKYFSNSIREDGLLAIARHGVIYAPGSAGTMQEIFMDACQNHYGTFGFVSPMVFLGQERWSERTGLYDLIKKEAAGRKYSGMLTLTDDEEIVVEFIRGHPPMAKSED